MMNPFDIIDKYYPAGTQARQILVTHSWYVAEKALSIAQHHPEMNPDLDFILEAAMLHDVGMFLCNAPSIDCHGDAPYICHGYLGAELVRKEGFPQHARVCERHTGTGLSVSMIESQLLPLPHQDFQPQTTEEKIICFADKFFSKTKLTKEKSVEKVRESVSKYGEETLARFDEWTKLFLETK